MHAQSGWNIIRLRGRPPATLKSLDGARDEIISTLGQQAMDQGLNDVTRHAHVQIIRQDYIQAPPSAQPPATDAPGP